jgi:hypothetical protein
MQFTIGAPALDKQFYGRTVQLRLLRNRPWAWICGQRRIGKSSLLRKVEQDVRDAGGLPLFTDLVDLDQAPDGQKLFRLVFRTNNRVLEERGLRLAQFNTLPPLERFSTLLERLGDGPGGQGQGGVAFLWDEAERLIELEQHDPGFLDQLGARLQRFARFRFLLGASQSLRVLYDSSCQFLDGFPWVPLGGLDDSECRSFLQGEQQDPWSPPLADEVVGQASQWSGGHPFLLQRLGEKLALSLPAAGARGAAASSDGGRITGAVVRGCQPPILRDRQVLDLFRDDFRRLSAHQQTVLRGLCGAAPGAGLTTPQLAAAAGLTATQAEDARQFLADYGYVTAGETAALRFEFYRDFTFVQGQEPGLEPKAASEPAERLRPELFRPAQLFVRDLSGDRKQMQLEFTLTLPTKATGLSDKKAIKRSELDSLLATITPRPPSMEQEQIFGKALAELVLPAAIARALVRLRDHYTVIDHDKPAAGIPWELMAIDDWFPAGGTGMSHRFTPRAGATEQLEAWFHKRPQTDTLRALLIVNPTGDLPGAEQEGAMLRQVFAADPAIDLEIIPDPGRKNDRPTRDRVRDALRSGRFDAVHYAGHAFFDPRSPERSGLVCAGDEVLSGKDLVGSGGMLPHLVVFNACESGRIRLRSAPAGKGASSGPEERLRGGASLAETLLAAGIGHYLGTFWEVGDDSAMAFARTFYGALGQGKSIGRALAAGRDVIRTQKSVDWLNYIHYGDCDFVLKHARR